MTAYDLVGSVTQPNMAFGVSSVTFCPEGCHVYVLGARTTDAVAILNTFDVSDPTTPTLLATLVLAGDVNGIKRGITVEGDYLYYSAGSFSGAGTGLMKVVDISTRSAPANALGGPTLGAGFQYEALNAPGDGYLYACVRHQSLAANATFHVYDLVTPTVPAIVGSVGMGNVAAYAEGRGLAVGADRALVVPGGSFSTPPTSLIDTSIKSAPVVLATDTHNTPLEQSALDPAGTVAYYHKGGAGPVIADTAEAVTALGNLGSLDISTLAGRSAFWHADHAIVPGYGVVDITDPANPVVAVVTADSFNKDWAADYHPGLFLTATAADANTGRLDIGLVVLGEPIIGSWAWVGLV